MQWQFHNRDLRGHDRNQALHSALGEAPVWHWNIAEAHIVWLLKILADFNTVTVMASVATAACCSNVLEPKSQRSIEISVYGKKLSYSSQGINSEQWNTSTKQSGAHQ